MLPHYIAINTTAGTASELTRFCVITDKERHVKMSIVAVVREMCIRDRW